MSYYTTFAVFKSVPLMPLWCRLTQVVLVEAIKWVSFCLLNGCPFIFFWCFLFLRERPGIDDIILILQQNRLRWYGHVLRKEDTDWVKKCMEYEVEGSRPRGRPKRTRTEVVQKDCQAHNLNREDAMDHGRWKKLCTLSSLETWGLFLQPPGPKPHV